MLLRANYYILIVKLSVIEPSTVERLLYLAYRSDTNQKSFIIKTKTIFIDRAYICSKTLIKLLIFFNSFC